MNSCLLLKMSKEKVTHDRTCGQSCTALQNATRYQLIFMSSVIIRSNVAHKSRLHSFNEAN